jgi:hypothetical protein
MGLIEKLGADLKFHTPDTGYNLVGIDDFELPGEMLYIIAHFDTWEEAIAVMRAQSHQDHVILIPSFRRASDEVEVEQV